MRTQTTTNYYFECLTFPNASDGSKSQTENWAKSLLTLIPPISLRDNQTPPSFHKIKTFKEIWNKVLDEQPPRSKSRWHIALLTALHCPHNAFSPEHCPLSPLSCYVCSVQCAKWAVQCAKRDSFRAVEAIGEYCLGFSQQPSTALPVSLTKCITLPVLCSVFNVQVTEVSLTYCSLPPSCLFLNTQLVLAGKQAGGAGGAKCPVNCPGPFVTHLGGQLCGAVLLKMWVLPKGFRGDEHFVNGRRASFVNSSPYHAPSFEHHLRPVGTTLSS